jgi:uncharacterized SAM-binding protein YcdF (DUF218 family)
MKLSELEKEDLGTLSKEQIAKVIYGDSLDTCEYADVALVLGGNPNHCGERAYKAAALWHEGRVKTLIPCGGVKWDFSGETLSECEYLARILLAEGVPADAILREDQSTTTKENMLYGTILFNRAFKIQNVKTVCIVTSAAHLRRAKAIAELFLPRSVKVVGCPASVPADPLGVLQTEHGRYFAMRELPLVHSMIRNGFMEDIEI